MNKLIDCWFIWFAVDWESASEIEEWHWQMGEGKGRIRRSSKSSGGMHRVLGGS